MRFTKEMMITAFLELYAIILANMQAIGGVRTDEAKYLLDIPYPHPPLVRGIFHLFEWLPFQEMFWRVILATLLAQAVWLVWDMAKHLATRERFAVVFTWLFSAALVMQIGTVMLAPVTALEALVFLWLLGRLDVKNHTLGQKTIDVLSRFVPFIRLKKEAHHEWLGFAVGLLWAVTLLTAFQGVLIFPIVAAVLLRLSIPRWQKFVYFFLPPVLLVLYTLSNPLALATIAIHSDGGLSGDVWGRIRSVLFLWLIAGSVVGSLYGTAGIFRSRSLALISSFLLVLAFVLLSVPYDYYAILFVPLLVYGMIEFCMHTTLGNFPYVPCLVGAMIVIAGLNPPWFIAPRTRTIVQAIEATKKPGDILIIGSFGHEWQYESRVPVHPYTQDLVEHAAAIVCNDSCEGGRLIGFHLLAGIRYEVWVRK